MQKCKVCSKRFKWSDICISVLCSYNPLKCDKCNSMHFPNLSIRVIIASCIGLPFLLLGKVLPVFKGYSLVLYLVWLVGIFALSPIVARYHIKK